MPLIAWDEKFSVGIAAVDHEHRALIALVNEAHARLGHPDAVVDVEDVLGEIYARIAAHFALEERLMQERRYDDYAAHKADHERLLDEIRDIMDDVEDYGIYDAPRLARRLAEWFSVHFQTHDARLHRNLS